MSILAHLLVASGLAVQASAAVHRIEAGNGGLVFRPDSVQTAVGDVLEFHFYALNHSVVSGNWENACQPAPDKGFSSGFNFVTNSTSEKVFRVTINDTTPIVYYCSQNTGDHCKKGMVGVVNPSESDTLEAYKEKAKSVTTAGNPPGEPTRAFGGVIATAGSDSNGDDNNSETHTSPTDPTAPINPSGSTIPTAPPGGAAGNIRVSVAALLGAGVLAMLMA